MKTLILSFLVLSSAFAQDVVLDKSLESRVLSVKSMCTSANSLAGRLTLLQQSAQSVLASNEKVCFWLGSVDVLVGNMYSALGSMVKYAGDNNDFSFVDKQLYNSNRTLHEIVYDALPSYCGLNSRGVAGNSGLSNVYPLQGRKLKQMVDQAKKNFETICSRISSYTFLYR